MRTSILELGALAAAVVALNLWATARISNEPDLPIHQKRLQLLFVWLFPVIGALVSIEVYRRSTPRTPRQRLAAEEIHPLVDQALRPIANGQTRASERYIENELIDVGPNMGGHGQSDGGHGP